MPTRRMIRSRPRLLAWHFPRVEELGVVSASGKGTLLLDAAQREKVSHPFKHDWTLQSQREGASAGAASILVHNCCFASSIREVG